MILAVVDQRDSPITPRLLLTPYNRENEIFCRDLLEIEQTELNGDYLFARQVCQETPSLDSFQRERQDYRDIRELVPSRRTVPPEIVSPKVTTLKNGVITAMQGEDLRLEMLAQQSKQFKRVRVECGSNVRILSQPYRCGEVSDQVWCIEANG